MNRRAIFASALLPSMLLLLVACGGGEGAPPPAKSPGAAPGAPAGDAPPPPPPPKPAEESKDDASGKKKANDAVIAEPRTVEEAQRQIDRAVADLDGASKESKPGKAPASEPNGGAKADDAGKNPCNALASMRRAVEALCRLTGETNNKCVEARKTLATNATKTATFKCKE